MHVCNKHSFLKNGGEISFRCHQFAGGFDKEASTLFEKVETALIVDWGHPKSNDHPSLAL